MGFVPLIQMVLSGARILPDAGPSAFMQTGSVNAVCRAQENCCVGKIGSGG